MKRFWPLLLDVVFVVIFAIVGRASHSHDLTLAGIFETGWPFVVACITGWVTLTFRADPGTDWSAGMFIWMMTLAGGMILRLVAGGTTAVAFIVVAGIFLALTLIGWRLIYAWRLKASKSASN